MIHLTIGCPTCENYCHPVCAELVKKNASDYEVVKEILTEYELIVDSYEQVRERPGDNNEQKKYFSSYVEQSYI